MSIEVSVIVPVYNAEEHLENLIRYMANQTFRDFELICVDDGSKDDSLKLLREAEEKNEWIHVLTQENQYAGIARNKGMEAAQGRYLVFLDADDIFHEDLLMELYQACEKQEADIAICGARNYFTKGGYYQYPNTYLDLSVLPEKECFSAEEIAEHIFDFTYVAAWNKMFRAEFVRENGILFMGTQRSNDVFFVTKALSCANRMTVVPKCLVTYRKEIDTSLQGTNTCQNNDFYEVVKELYFDLKNRKVEPLYRKSFCNRVMSICLHNVNMTSDREFYESSHEKILNVFYEFGLVNHGRGYYFNKTNFERMLFLLKSDVEEAWEEQVRRKEKMTGVIPVAGYPVPLKEVSGKVSVLVWVHNTEPYLEACLESLRNQTHKNFEVICVDDGSTDGSGKILDAFADKDDRFRVLHEAHPGKAASYNLALECAEGEYVYFLESSDYLEAGALEILAAEAETRDLSMLMINGENVFTPEEIRYVRNGFNPNYVRLNNYSEVRGGRELFTDLISEGDDRYHTGLSFYRRDFLQEHELRYPEGLLHCEEVFLANALSYADRACLLNINLLKHRITAEKIQDLADLYLHSTEDVMAAKVMMDFYFAQALYEDEAFGNAYLDHMAKVYKTAFRRIRKGNDEELQVRFEEFLQDYDFKMRFLMERIRRDTDSQKALQNISMKDCQNKKISQDLKNQKEKVKDLKEKKKQQAEKIKDLKEKLAAAKQENKEAQKTIRELSEKITLSRILRKVYRTIKKQ